MSSQPSSPRPSPPAKTADAPPRSATPGHVRVASGLVAVGLTANAVLWFFARALALIVAPAAVLTLIGAAVLAVVVGAALIVGRRPLPTFGWTAAALVTAPLFWLLWAIVVVQNLRGDSRRRARDSQGEVVFDEPPAASRPALRPAERAMIYLAVLATCTLALIGLAMILSVAPVLRTAAELEGRTQAEGDLRRGDAVYRLIVQQDPQEIEPLVFDYAHGLPPHVERVDTMWDLAYRRTRAYNETVADWVRAHGLPPESARRKLPADLASDDADGSARLDAVLALLAAMRADSPPAPGTHRAPGGSVASVTVGAPRETGVPVTLRLDAERTITWLPSDVYALRWLTPQHVALVTRRADRPRNRLDIFDVEVGRIAYGVPLYTRLRTPWPLREQPTAGLPLIDGFTGLRRSALDASH